MLCYNKKIIIIFHNYKYIITKIKTQIKTEIIFRIFCSTETEGDRRLEIKFKGEKDSIQESPH